MRNSKLSNGQFDDSRQELSSGPLSRVPNNRPAGGSLFASRHITPSMPQNRPAQADTNRRVSQDSISLLFTLPTSLRQKSALQNRQRTHKKIDWFQKELNDYLVDYMCCEGSKGLAPPFHSVVFSRRGCFLGALQQKKAFNLIDLSVQSLVQDKFD